MAGFKLEAFRGIRPRLSARLLDITEAQTARDARVGSGELRPLRAAVAEATLTAGHSTIFRIADGNVWRSWATDVDMSRGPVPADTRNRHYFTGDGLPKMLFKYDITKPNSGYTEWRRLGIPAPAAALTYSAVPLITVTGTITAISAKAMILPSNHRFRGRWPDDPSPRFYTRDIGGRSFPFPAGSTQTFNIGLNVGDSFTVTVDSPTTIRITSLGASYLAAGEALAAYPWGCEMPNTTQNKYQETGGLVRPANEGTITFGAAHGLYTGDTIQISSITTQPVSVARNEFLGLGGYVASLDTDVTLTYTGSVEYEVFRDSGITNIVDRTYVYTYVSDLGEEGPPSPASAIATVVESNSLTLTGFTSPPTDRVSINRIRIYRAAVGFDGTAEFQYLTEFAVGTTTYVDATTDFGLGEVIQSVTWDVPDADMKGLVSLPNGVFAGFFGKTLCLSEPGFPHAWPPEYRLTTDYEIVGLGVFGNSVLVCTAGSPYVASGSQPRNMSLRRIEVEQACVAKNSIVNIGDVVLYASPDGLCAAGHSGFDIISRHYFGRDDWQALDPETIHAVAHDEKYVAFYAATEPGAVNSPVYLSASWASYGNVSPTMLSASVQMGGDFGGFYRYIDEALVPAGNVEYQATINAGGTGWAANDYAKTYEGFLIDAPAAVAAEYAQYPAFIYPPLGGILVGMSGLAAGSGFNAVRITSFDAAGAPVATTSAAIPTPIGIGAAATINLLVRRVGGLIYVSVDGAEIVTGWNPGAYHQAGRHFALASYNVDGSQGTYIYSDIVVTGADIVTPGSVLFDPLHPEIGLVTTTDTSVCEFVDLLTDSVYLSNGTAVTKWDAGANRTFLWRSKVLAADYPNNPGCARVLASTYPVTFRLYADSVLKHTQTVSSSEAFRLPSGYLASLFEIELEASSNVLMAQVAETLDEIMNS